MYRKFRNVPIFKDIPPICPYFLGFRVGKYVFLIIIYKNIFFFMFYLCTGVKKGDRVAIYMPMIVELVTAMLACARIGAMHSIVVSDLKCSFVFKLLVLLSTSPLSTKLVTKQQFEKIRHVNKDSVLST